MGVRGRKGRREEVLEGDKELEVLTCGVKVMDNSVIMTLF